MLTVDSIMNLEGTPHQVSRTTLVQSLSDMQVLARRLTAVVCGYVAVHGHVDSADDVLRQARAAGLPLPLVSVD